MYIHLGNFLPKKKHFSVLKATFKNRYDDETFYSMKAPIDGIYPDELIDAVKSHEFSLIKDFIGGYVTNVEPHTDDIGEPQTHSLVWFPYCNVKHNVIHFYTEGGMHKLVEGDAVIFNHMESHSVMPPSYKDRRGKLPKVGTVLYIATFLDHHEYNLSEHELGH